MSEDTIDILARRFGVPRDEIEAKTSQVVDTVMNKLLPQNMTARDEYKIQQFEKKLQKEVKRNLEFARMAIDAETQKGFSRLYAIALMKVYESMPRGSDFYRNAMNAAKNRDLSHLQAAIFWNIKSRPVIPLHFREKLMGWNPFPFRSKNSEQK